jgi:histone acetyltransferase (RNA polymerase elongator complex component)
MDRHPLVKSNPFIIPVFLPHTGCRHRCSFCDQSAITGQKAAPPKPEQVRREILSFLGYKRGPRSPVQISFYGGIFLGQPEKTVRRLLDVASDFIKPGPVESIRFSTRPDTIDSERLGWLSQYPVATIEIGAQSMNDRVLQNSNRGHTARDTEKAMALLKAKGYETGLQMMLGLPGDCAAGSLDTGRRILDLGPDFVRIYPAVVLAGSVLADWFAAGRYEPFSLETAVEITGRLYRLFVNRGVRVVRMGLQASEDLNRGNTILAGPFHPAFGQLVISNLFLDSVCRALQKAGASGNTISVAVNPRSVSNLRGQNNSNIESLKRLFSADTITVLSKPDLDETAVVVNAGDPVSILTGA